MITEYDYLDILIEQVNAVRTHVANLEAKSIDWNAYGSEAGWYDLGVSIRLLVRVYDAVGKALER